MITGGDLRQSRLDVGYKTFTISPWIVAIADVFDALTSTRPYKKAWSVDDAVAHLEVEAGKHFDPDLIPIFLNNLPEIIEIKERWPEKES